MPETTPPFDFFTDPRLAEAAMHRIASKNNGFAQVSPLLLTALASAADPDRSLINFERFAENYGEDLFTVLQHNPRVIEILVTLFSASQFLTEILLRHPRFLSLLFDRQKLTHRKTIEQIQSEVESILRSAAPSAPDLRLSASSSVASSAAPDIRLSASPSVASSAAPSAPDIRLSASSSVAPSAAPSAASAADLLRLYHQSELLRIGASDFLDLYDLRAVISQLSRLAIALIRTALTLACKQTGIHAQGFVVLAMGKLGGRELNYSSDIDLLFLARDSTIDYLPLAQKLIEILSANTDQGFLYRVDMRLRPWGKDGPLVPTLVGYLKYLERDARPWEKQALLKVRPIAGDLALGEQFREAIQPHLFEQPPEEIRAQVFAMKQRTEEFLREKGRTWGEVKLGIGSIRDIEFVVQYLQLAYVRQFPHIRTRATLKALPRLRAAGLLSSADTRILTDGYIFLRTIEHYLQMMDYRQTYTLPSEPRAITLLARRLGFPHAEAFLQRYQEHCQAIRAVYLRHIGSEPMTEETSPLVRQHLARMDASYSEIFTPAEIQNHAALAQKLNEDTLAVVEAIPLEPNTWRVTIVGYDFPGELSIICGLFFVHGFNILEGDVFTYEPDESASQPLQPAPGAASPFLVGRRLLRRLRASVSAASSRPKIVDVFTVKSVFFEPHGPEIWSRYATELQELLAKLRAGQRREARGALAKRVGAAFQAVPGKASPLLPIDIEIDNTVSDRYTVLRIDAPDTVGFLYEFSNALAFTRTNIARMVVRTVGNRAKDVLYVTDAEGRKIESPQRQRELRAAIVLIKHFTHLLPHSPNPEAALLHFREFIYQLFQRPNWPDEIASLERSDVLKALARVLGISDFLWDDFLRMQYANLFPLVRDVESLAAGKPRADLEAELTLAVETCAVGESEYSNWREALNAFKDRELFRIDMRHILGLTAEFWDFAAELTDLAEVVILTALERCQAELTEKYGLPEQEDGSPCPLSVLALGKCGGRELGFASDIELMFVYAGQGRTTGPEITDTGDYYEKLVQSVLSTVHARQEGIFQIDLQLRPYGKAGSMAVSLESFRRYYAPNGPAWAYERQALVKLRPIAGDPALGAEIGRLRDEYVYHGGPFDVTAMRAMRERQIRHLVTGGTFNAKFSPGGLVDVEYLIQGLQINYGAQNPALRVTNLREAMTALYQAGILSEADYTTLRKAHTFLRWLIDSLRVVRGNAKDVTVPPYDSEEFHFLARRLRYGDDTARLRDDLLRYQTEVQEINQRLLG
ncbi:MAG: glutamine synthetase adenylyltransferase [Anaerolineae bacterium]|nr:MAG: glutamine synthetase adenylyltransferase [Anaerolineae bacterium]